MSRRSDLTRALEAELKRHGRKGRVEHGGKHPRLIFRHQGQEHRMVIPGSPSDRRSWLNSRAMVRRILREGR